MADRARVHSVDELRKFRSGLCDFIEECQSALLMIRAEISRTQSWIERDRLVYWERAVKRRTKELSDARNALNRKEITSDRTLEERRAVDRAKQRLEEARQKVRLVKRWAQMFPQELERLIGAIRQLTSIIDREGPEAVKSLDHIIESLMQYFAEQMPATGGRRGLGVPEQEPPTDGESENSATSAPGDRVQKGDSS